MCTSLSTDAQPCVLPLQNVLVQEELHMQVRLAPLHPKASAPIKHLAAGLGCLFAAPSLEPGGMLQWGMKAHDHQAAGSAASSPASSKASLPRNYDVVPGLPAGGTQAPGEDWDSAPCAGVSPQPALQSIREGKPPRVSCLLLDAGSGRLWAGCDDGRVCCWGVETGKAARCQHSWVAHRGSKVKALVLTPWGKVITGGWLVLTHKGRRHSPYCVHVMSCLSFALLSIACQQEEAHLRMHDVKL